MPALAFDTHAYVKKLRDAGVPEAQAEIQVEAIVAILEKRMVTREDLELHKTEILREIAEVKRDIAEVRRDVKELDVKLETRLKELEMRLLIRLGSLLLVGIGAIATLVKVL